VSDTSAIEILSLNKRFGEKYAVRDVTFSVRSGEVFGFMGHNGAGKTTTLRMLLGLLQPTSGSARVLGHGVVSESLVVAWSGRRYAARRIAGE
jgi:ABC-2 type transport system ATP-binding protein